MGSWDMWYMSCIPAHGMKRNGMVGNTSILSAWDMGRVAINSINKSINQFSQLVFDGF